MEWGRAGEKPLEKGGYGGGQQAIQQGRDLGKSPVCDVSEGLEIRGVSYPRLWVGSKDGWEAAGWTGSSRQPVSFDGLWSQQGERTSSVATGLPEAHLGSCVVSPHRHQSSQAGGGLNRLWLRFKHPPKQGALLHPQAQRPSLCFLEMSCVVMA